MVTEESKTFEFRTFVLGAVIFGGVFGTVIFRNASELWASASTWSLASSIGASLLLCLIPISSYRPQSGVKIRTFLVSLALTVGLIMWYDAGHRLPGPVDSAGVKGLLQGVQLAISWKYRLFVLFPTILTMAAQWVCGAFLLSLRRFIVGPMNKSLLQSRALFASTTVGVAVLLAFTIWLSALEESGSIFVSLQYPEGFSVEKRNSEIDVFIGRIDVEHALASSIFERQVLFEIKQGDRWRRGESRKLLEDSLRVYENRVIGLTVFDSVSRPSVPMRESYTSTTLNFVPNSARLEELGISEAAIATRLRLTSDFESLQTLRGIVVEGKRFHLVPTPHRRA